MACSHTNPPTHRFCTTCGESLPQIGCTCGFACRPGDVYCGQCGKCLAESRGRTKTDAAVAAGKLNLALFVTAAPAEEAAQAPAKSGGAHIDQDAIRKLLLAKKQKA